MSAKQRIIRARTSIVISERMAFWGMLASRLELVERPDIETAAVDGKRFYFNPQFIEELTDRQVVGLCAHEVMHCANGHCWRRGDRNAELWNIAADEVINHILTTSGFELPPGGLPGVPDISVEAQYAKHAQRSGGGKGKGQPKPGAGQPGQGKLGQCPDPGRCGAVIDGADDPGDSGSEEAWKAAVINAAMISRSRGTCPEFAELLVKEFTRQRLDWRTLLADFVQLCARNDYNWTRANSRYLHTGFVLPSLISNELPAGVIVRDTSGSVVGAIPDFTTEVSAVLEAYPTRVHVLDVDTHVRAVREYGTEDMPIEPFNGMGGGGTCFEPAFDWVREQGIQPAYMIYLTDLYGSFPDEVPDYPVLWVCIEEDGHAPFGQVVYMDRRN